MRTQDALNPPTIAYLRARNGCPGLRVFCNNHHCLHRTDFLWLKLGKPDTTPPVAIRFKYSKRGSRDVDTIPDWPIENAIQIEISRTIVGFTW